MLQAAASRHSTRQTASAARRFRFRRFSGSPVSVPSSLSDEASDGERDRLAGALGPQSRFERGAISRIGAACSCS